MKFFATKFELTCMSSDKVEYVMSWNKGNNGNFFVGIMRGDANNIVIAKLYEIRDIIFNSTEDIISYINNFDLSDISNEYSVLTLSVSFTSIEDISTQSKISGTLSVTTNNKEV